LVNVIFAKIRLPLFSVKQPESFQVMSSMPIPQPSSLIGALAYCLGVISGEGVKALNKVYEMVERGDILAARARPWSDGGAATPLTLSTVILRRFRVVDKAHEKKRRGEVKPAERLSKAVSGGDLVQAKRILEIELTDAFYREYVMGIDMLCAWVVREGVIDPESVKLIPRLGDTESLCTVIKVWSEKCGTAKKTIVETSFPAPALGKARVLEGSFMYMKLCDELRRLVPFIVPCEVRVERSGKVRYPAIRPTAVRIEYEEGARVCETSVGDIVLGVGES